MARDVRKIHTTPAVMRRQLKVALRQEREAAELTQREAAAKLDWHVSKIIRIEAGTVSITPVDLRALLAVYGVTDEQQVAELVELAKASRRQPWSEYRGVYSPAALALFDSEAAAKIIYKYEPTFVPGLFQTEEYARALLAELGKEPHEIDSMVAARIERQELLEQDARPELVFVLGEAVVSRAVGGRRVMVRQLEHLRQLGTRPGISIQVLPFSTGAHPRMGTAITVLQFPGETLDDLLYLENAGGESVSREDPDEVADHLRDLFTLQSRATDPAAIGAVIDSVIAGRFADGASVLTADVGASTG